MNSINSWLCKNFDNEKKGYVTLGEFTNAIFFISVVITFILFIFYSVYVFFSRGAFWSETTDGVFSFQIFGGLIILLILLFLIFIAIRGISSLWEYLSKIKIAKCEMKKDNENL